MGKKQKKNASKFKSIPSTSLIGLLADNAVVHHLNVPDSDSASVTLGDVISTIGDNLQGHVNRVFRLMDNPLTLDIKNAQVPGNILF